MLYLSLSLSFWSEIRVLGCLDMFLPNRVLLFSDVVWLARRLIASLSAGARHSGLYNGGGSSVDRPAVNAFLSNLNRLGNVLLNFVNSLLQDSLLLCERFMLVFPIPLPLLLKLLLLVSLLLLVGY